MHVKRDPEAISLDTFLLYKVSLLADLIARRTSAIAKQQSLNISHWRVLAAIADSPGRTANQVVAITPMDKGIVSRAVKGLIESGYVTRKASDADGRIAHLFLTDTGAKAYRAMARKAEEVEAIMTQEISDKEKKAFNAAVQKLSSALSTENS